ncbi:MAG: hypothetical protein HY896_08615 [Deltaproteobacteria bacterium]|nr:hypothetical protein [Deltaproteobacteria bacterium]
MSRNRRMIHRIALSIFFLVFTFQAISLPVPVAAASTPLSRPDIADRLSGINTFGMIYPEIRIYEMSAGGVREYMDDWSAKGKENVAKFLKDAFGDRLAERRKEVLDNAVRDELEEVIALYEVAIASYFQQAAPINGFPEKRGFSAYELGPLDNLFASLGVDGLIVVKGVDVISTGGRKTLAVIGAMAGIGLPLGFTGMDIGFIDRSGGILWFNSKGSVVGNDFREPEEAAKITGETLSGFPGLKP